MTIYGPHPQIIPYILIPRLKVITIFHSLHFQFALVLNMYWRSNFSWTCGFDIEILNPPINFLRLLLIRMSDMHSHGITK